MTFVSEVSQALSKLKQSDSGSRQQDLVAAQQRACELGMRRIRPNARRNTVLAIEAGFGGCCNPSQWLRQFCVALER
jgi:hypothetical protein